MIGSATFTQRTPWQGSVVSGAFDNNRATTDNPFVSLNPQYTTNLSFTFTQPILRNRTIDSGRRQIRIAKKRLDISDSQFRQRAIGAARKGAQMITITVRYTRYALATLTSAESLFGANLN